jgi:uncharacterized iron-regulated membrane protein
VNAVGIFFGFVVCLLVLTGGVAGVALFFVRAMKRIEAKNSPAARAKELSEAMKKLREQDPSATLDDLIPNRERR